LNVESSLEVVIIRRLLLIVPVLLVIILSGCQNAFGFINENWLAEVTLTYREYDAKPAEEAPFETKAFADSAFIKTMAEAMNKSKRLMGKIDYSPDFEMVLNYDDGYTEKYFLALGSKAGHPGLLVASDKRGYAYNIPVKNADRLRAFIFGAAGASGNAGAGKDKSSLTASGTVTLSHNELFPVTGRREFLDLRLVKGEYSEDWITPGPLAGSSWSGIFQLVVSDEQGKALSTFPLSGHFTEELLFNDFFQIQFDDYNGDGHPDFTIGQYGTSNGSFYKLFTLGSNNVIEELKFEPVQDLFISSPERYSLKLDKVDNLSFKKNYYNNASGKQVEEVYRWDGKVFRKLDK